MGIRPTGNGPKPVYVSDDTTGRYQNWVSDLEQAGDTGGDVIAEIDAKASSSNSTAEQLAADITALESRLDTLPLVLFWNGSGTKPTLKPAWGLLNTSTGEFEKGA